MKKLVALIVIFLLLCLLCSCEIFYTPDFQCIIDSAGYIDMYIYKGQEYLHSSPNEENYSFYWLTDEKVIGHFPMSCMFFTFYEVNNPDFGIVLRHHPTGLDRTPFCFLPFYCLPKDVEMPDIKTVELDKVIISKDTDGVLIKNREGPSDFDNNSLFIVLNNEESYKDKSLSTFSDILDFSDIIPEEHIASLEGGATWEKDKDYDYDYYRWGSLFATLKDYKSFFCGPLLVIEYDNRLYAKIESTIDDSSEYIAVREEYQELFRNAMEQNSN